MNKKVGLFITILLIPLCSLPSETKEFAKLYNQASVYLDGSPDSAILYANKAFLSIEFSNRYELQIDAIMLGVNGYVLTGNWGEAYQGCIKALDISNKNDLTIRLIQILGELGNIFISNGLYSEASAYLFRSLKIADSIHETKYIDDVHYYLGLLYSDLDEVNKSKFYINQSIHYSQLNNNHALIVNNYLLISTLFYLPDSINKYLNLAEQFIENTIDLEFEKAVLRNNQALLNKALDNLSQSKSQYLEAIDISESNGFTEHLANLYNNYAYLLIAEDKYDSAKISLDFALEAALEIQSLDLEASIYDSYSDYFKTIGELEDALEYSDISIAKRNEYSERQRAQESLFLSVVFETEQKEKEILQKESKLNRSRSYLFGASAFIILLVAGLIYFRQKLQLSKIRLIAFQKSKSLDVANAMIEGQDVERKRLAMDLHDGMGAQLGSLRFQVDTFFDKDPNYIQVIGSIDEIGKNIRDLSHRMSPSRLEEYGLIRTLTNLIESIKSSGRINVEFSTNIDLKDRFDEKLEINLYYLVFELINNATKHSKAKNIQVQIYLHDENLSISVEDDGIGFAQDEAKEGHGLKNIKRRITFLNGHLIVDSRENLGASFMIEIPFDK